MSQLLAELAEYKLKNFTTENIWKSSANLSALSWWKAFFPNNQITKIVLRVLNLPATSASCERNFKTYANIKTKKRNRLTIERTNKLAFIK